MRSAALVLQREAAFRWAGLPHESVVSILTKARFDVDIRLALRRRDFRPYAAADAVVLGMARRETPLLPPSEEGAFAAFVRLGFGRGRESLRKNFSPVTPYERFREIARQHNLPLDVTPSETPLGAWLALWEASKAQRGTVYSDHDHARSRPRPPRSRQ
ncbi:MAG: rRNA adenine N-6-methyltransferase family protein [Dehalococcoidia bacterium]